MTATPKQHHVFIVDGVSEDAMKAHAYKRTAEDSELEYYIHYHGYTMGVVYGREEVTNLVCGGMCQVIRNGKLQGPSVITQSDDANAISAG